MPSFVYINDENTIRELFDRGGTKYKHTKVQSIINEFVNSDNLAAIMDWHALGYSSINSCVSSFSISIKRYGKYNVVVRQRENNVYLIRKDRLNDVLNKEVKE